MCGSSQLNCRALVPYCQHVYRCSHGYPARIGSTLLVCVEGVEGVERLGRDALLMNGRTELVGNPREPPTLPKLAQLHPHMEQAAHQTGDRGGRRFYRTPPDYTRGQLRPPMQLTRKHHQHQHHHHRLRYHHRTITFRIPDPHPAASTTHLEHDLCAEEGCQTSYPID